MDKEQKNLTVSTSLLSQQQQHSDDPPSSSSASSSTEPEMVQESKKLKQEEDDKDTTTPSSPPPSQRISLPSIPPASQRPLYNNPRSGRPPRSPQRPPRSPQSPPQTRRSETGPPLTTPTPTTVTPGPIGAGPISAGRLQPKGYSNTAQLLLNEPDERAHARFRLERQKAKKTTADWTNAGAGMITTRPGRSSPLGPGPDPYEKVMEVVSDVKEHLKQLKAKKLAAKNSLWSSSFSNSDSDSEPCSVEEVIRKLGKYMKGISKTVSAQEMEDKLLEFQIKVDADPPPTWYSLIKKSTIAFWDSLTDHFVVEALEDSDKEDDDMSVDDDIDDSIDKGGKCSSSSGTSGLSKAT